MEGQGVTASAASAADRNGGSGRSAVAAAELDDPGMSHVTGDVVDNGEGQRSNEDDTVVIPAVGQSEASMPEQPGQLEEVSAPEALAAPETASPPEALEAPEAAAPAEPPAARAIVLARGGRGRSHRATDCGSEQSSRDGDCESHDEVAHGRSASSVRAVHDGTAEHVGRERRHGERGAHTRRLHGRPPPRAPVRTPRRRSRASARRTSSALVRAAPSWWSP